MRKNADQTPKYATISGAADYLGVSRSYVRLLIKDGTLREEPCLGTIHLLLMEDVEQVKQKRQRRQSEK